MRRLWAAVLLPFVSGCVVVYSIAPVVPDSASVLDERLLGSWQTTNDTGHPESAMLARAESGYAILYVSDHGDSSRFNGRLGRIGGRWILDLSPGGEAAGMARLWGSFMVPTHLALVLEIREPEVDVATLQGDSVLAGLRAGRLHLAYFELPNGDVVLTGSSAELAAGLEEYLTWPGGLGPFGIWRRIKASPAPHDPPPR